MPLCPECQTPYEEGQHYCKQCGHDLKTVQPPSPRCPRCGASVTADQNFCHECDAPLKKRETSLPSFISKVWLISLIAVVVLGVALILVLQLSRQPSPSPSSVTQQVPATAPAAKPVEAEPAQPLASSREASLQTGLEKVLYNLREANLNKDILLYMSCLSFLYPQLDKKRQETLTTWGKFDFKKMVFSLNKIRELGGDDAVAEVTWSTLTQNLTTKDLQTNDFAYKVWFTKELGQWKIKKIEDLES